MITTTSTTRPVVRFKNMAIQNSYETGNGSGNGTGCGDGSGLGNGNGYGSGYAWDDAL